VSAIDGIGCKYGPVGYAIILFIGFYPELIGSAIAFHFEDDASTTIKIVFRSACVSSKTTLFSALLSAK